MPSKTLVALAAGAALLLPAAGAHASTSCTTTTEASAAATALYGAGTELVRTEQIAGLDTALVLEPRIAPGTRRRMVRTAQGWCDAANGFNRAWKGSADGAATAAAYARLAAAPYFDGVTVRSAKTTAPGVHVVQTHARTNGIVARWVITTDAGGVRTATWKATDFAVKPFEGEEEGLSALPGATERYTRGFDGLLAEARGLPTAESAHRAAQAAPAPALAVYKSPDNFTIRVSLGEARVAVDPGMSTGVREADFIQNTMEALRINYQEFYDWGLRKGWSSDLDPALPDTGWMYLNDSLSLYCWACVFIANDFQIHMTSEVNRILAALGFDGYQDQRKSYINVVGHEMFHNFQNAYNKPGPLGRMAGRGVSTAYSEGTARFQETLHSYADVSFTNKTLVTGGQTNPPGLSLDGNHCNGYGNTQAAHAGGPFGKSYNACYFWTAWYTQNGPQAFTKLVSEAYPAHSPSGNVHEGVLALASASSVPVGDQLAWYAMSSLTGGGRNYAPLSGGGAAMDWGTFFFKWAPPILQPGEEAAQSITGGGVHARRIDRAARVSLTGDGLAFYEVRSSGAGSSFKPIAASGADIAAPAADEKVWVVAANPNATATVTAVTGTIRAE